MDNVPLSVPVHELAAQANSYASANGVQVEKRYENDKSKSYFECAPMSLLPNAYPKRAFGQAQELAPHFNQLVDRVSRDADFLHQTLGGGVSDTDPYTAKLLQLYKEIYVQESGEPNFAKTADFLGIHRSDYMLHKDKGSDQYNIKQVELNTIASSFAGLSTKVSALHRHLTSRFEDDVKDLLETNKKVVLGSDEATTNGDTPDGVPVNPALERIPSAMKVAFAQYQSRFSPDPKKTVILFVVQDGETNTVDQRMLEFQLWQDHQVPVVRMSLTSAHTEIELDGKTGALKIASTGQEIAVVYFRAGYAPTDYPDGYDGIEWKARAKLERSRATKSPSLGYHLAGTKKVQQELARPGSLERFFPQDSDKVIIEGLKQAFAGLYSLGDDATEEDKSAVKDVLAGAEGKYVLKPQREGGGYNFYGENLLAKLKANVKQTDSDVELAPVLGEFILMERLFPPIQKAILLRGGKVEGSGDTISELGCFATVVASTDGNVLHNEYAGFLLRTKFSNVDEGGVASGFATLSSPYLC